MSRSSMVLFLQLHHHKILREKMEKILLPQQNIERVKVGYLHSSISATTNTSVKQLGVSKADQKTAKPTLKEVVSIV